MSSREIAILNQVTEAQARKIFSDIELPADSLQDLEEEFYLEFDACMCESNGAIDCQIHTARYCRPNK